MPTPIRRRLLAARQDCVMAGNKPIRARISSQDMTELKRWQQSQQHPLDSGLPPNKASLKELFGLDVVEDAKIKDGMIHFDLEKKSGA